MENKLINQTVKKSKKVKFSNKVFIKLFEYQKECECLFTSDVNEFGKPKSKEDWVPIQN